MKQFILSLLAVCALNQSFSQPVSADSYQAECIGEGTAGVTRLKVAAFDRKARTDINLIKKMALDAVLFRGVAAGTGCVPQPPLLGTKLAEAKSGYFDDFFGKGSTYAKYVVAVEEISSDEMDEVRKHQKVVHSAIISVNKDLLRKDLLADKVLEPLTQGF